jgi:hypothetical protein
MSIGQKTAFREMAKFRSFGNRLLPLLLVAIAGALMSLNCFGANGTGATSLALMVQPEARLSVKDLSKEIRQDLGVEIRWVQVDLTVRTSANGTASLSLHNAASAVNYKIDGADSLELNQAKAIDSDVVLQPTKNGRYFITLGIARSLDQSADVDAKAVLELKSSDGALNVSKAL